MTDYIGTISGISGMIFGGYGAVVGHLAYRRTQKIKELDLRLELRKGITETHVALVNLKDLMDYANKSRIAVLNMRGLGQSGSKINWDQMFQNDQEAVKKIAAELRSESADFSELSSDELEANIVSTHKLKVVIGAISDRYKGAVALDDQLRQEKRQEQSATWTNVRSQFP